MTGLRSLNERHGRIFKNAHLSTSQLVANGKKYDLTQLQHIIKIVSAGEH